VRGGRGGAGEAGHDLRAAAGDGLQRPPGSAPPAQEGRGVQSGGTSPTRPPLIRRRSNTVLKHFDP